MLLLPALLACAAVSRAESGSHWYDRAVIYEIYPRSFQDTNNDGIGDLKGVTMRLDYLKQLGVDAIWITPFFPSPNVDFGYDVADYTNVAREYGTMQDWDRLVVEARSAIFESWSISSSITPPINTPGSKNPDPLATTRSATGTYGATVRSAGRTAHSLDVHLSAATPGRGIRRRSNGSTTFLLRSSRM